MKFLVTWSIREDQYVNCLKRFTQGNPADEFPDNVKLIGRWHTGVSRSGALVLESNSESGIMSWAMKWNDLLDFTIEPAVEDEEAGRLCLEKLASLGE